MSLVAEELLQDRYQIVRIIKSGGMGSVYEARDTKLADSPCAVKEIHEAARTGKDGEYIMGRFKEEMKSLALLDHPSIPKVRDFLTIDSTIFIVMDLVQGRSLEEELEETMATSGRPPSADHIVIDMLRLLETLSYLHEQDPPIIHRDVKPANILRDRRSGAIKLVDFGLAKSVGGTQTQTVVGTMGYCSPEQMMGKAEQRSDVYSVGVTMCHLLTGAAPEMMLFEPRRPELPNARPGLLEIIEKATQPHPGERYGSAREMANDLQDWLRGETAPTTVKIEAIPESAPPPRGASTTRLLTAPPKMTRARTAGVMALVLGGAFLLGKITSPSPQPTTTPLAMASPSASPTPVPDPPVLALSLDASKVVATSASTHLNTMLAQHQAELARQAEAARRAEVARRAEAARQARAYSQRPVAHNYSRPSQPHHASQPHYASRPEQPKRFLGIQYGTKRGERALNTVINVFR